MKANRFLVIAAIATLALLCIGTSWVRADVASPKPRWTWDGGKSPCETGVVIAGVAMSAAIVVIGLMLARLPFFKSRITTLVIAAVATAAVAGVVYGACAYVGLIRADQKQWDEWRENESGRGRSMRQWIMEETRKMRDSTEAK